MKSHSRSRHKQLYENRHDSSDGIFSDQNGGVALVLVLWVVVVLVAIVGEFSYSMRTEINITRNFKEEEEAYQLALSGIEQAKAEILNTENLSRAYVDSNDVLIFDPDGEPPERKGSLGKGSFQYTITNEEGKMDLNFATIEQLQKIFQNAAVESTEIDTIVDSILDWRDTDDLHMLNGAEDDYYESLDRPYSSKDDLFDSPEEILLVKGMTPEIFYGPKKGEEEKVSEGVGKYFTVHGLEAPNKNTAPRAVLEAYFESDEADNILAQRETGPIVNYSVVPEYFTIISTGSNADGKIKRTVKAIVQKQEDTLEIIYWNDNIIG